MAKGQSVNKGLIIILLIVGATSIWSMLKSLFIKRADEEPGQRLDLAQHPRMRALLTILASMGAQGPVLTWAATHRYHHQFSEMPEDLARQIGDGLRATVRNGEPARSRGADADRLERARPAGETRRRLLRLVARERHAPRIAEQLAQPQRDIKHQVFLAQPIGTNRSSVVPAMAGIHHDLANLQAQRANQ